MKFKLLLGVISLSVAMFISCGADENTENSVEETTGSVSEEKQPTFETVMADIDSYEGKEVTLKLNVVEIMKINGQELVRFAGEKELAFGESPFTVILGDENDPFRKLKEGDSVSLSGRVEFGDFGYILLEDAKIL